LVRTINRRLRRRDHNIGLRGHSEEFPWWLKPRIGRDLAIEEQLVHLDEDLAEAGIMVPAEYEPYSVNEKEAAEAATQGLIELIRRSDPDWTSIDARRAA
jgi:hypothetical protein